MTNWLKHVWLICCLIISEEAAALLRTPQLKQTVFESHTLGVDENRAVAAVHCWPPEAWSLWRSLLLWPDCSLRVFQEVLSGGGKVNEHLGL